MIGIWANAATVIVGGILGTLMRGGIKVSVRKTVNAGLALCVLLIGIRGAIQTSNLMIVIVSMIVGALLGEAMHIEDGLNKLGAWAQNRFAKKSDGFAVGFVNATLLFCVGAMAVVGSLEAGLSNKSDTLMAKAALDGVSALIFASSFGIGVAFSAIPLTIYQGGIALLASVLAPYLTDELVTEMSAVGSLLIICIAINMMEVTKERIRVGNFLPAILIPCIYIPVANWLSTIF